MVYIWRAPCNLLSILIRKINIESPKRSLLGFAIGGICKYLIRLSKMVNMNAKNLFCLLFCTLERDFLLLQCFNGFRFRAIH